MPDRPGGTEPAAMEVDATADRARLRGGGQGSARPEWSFELETRSEAETRALAHVLGEVAVAGWVVLLVGPLGAGKTVFAQGLLRGLGVTGRVRSPTFTIVNEYPGDLTAWHADLFRLSGDDDFAEVGGDELLLGGEGVVVVEWAERLSGLVPHDRAWVELSFGSAGAPDNRRKITIGLKGRAYEAAAGALDCWLLGGRGQR